MPGATGEPVVIADYDPTWPVLYEAERTRIIDAADAWIVAIEHVGSTAVRGLAAKPVVDIAAGVERFEDGAHCVEPLERIGWQYRGDGGIPGRYYFVKYVEGVRTYQLHLVEFGGEHWRRYTAFRDQLRANAAVAAEYASLKRALAEQHHEDRVAYNEAKTDFITAAMREALQRPSG